MIEDWRAARRRIQSGVREGMRSLRDSRAVRRLGGTRAGRRLRAYWPPPLAHLAIAAALTVGVGLILWETCGLVGCPNVEVLAAYQPGNAPVVLDRDGSEVTRLAPVLRELVEIESLPEHVQAAFIAIEDRRFRDHGGVDARRILGSLLANVKAGGVAQGGSTITMQLARNVFPDRLPGQERTIRRKVLEVRVAQEIEDRFSKDEILELYLNHIYFGGPIYGIETAARHYFGHGAADLELAEAATLAAMPKAPNRYDPRQHPEDTRERRDLVLRLMEQQGRIGAEEAERARARPLRTVWPRSPRQPSPPPAPYFVRVVRRLLERELGDGLYAGPLRIHTTLDLDAQAAAERALHRQLRTIERGVYGRFSAPWYGGREAAVDSAGTRYLQGAVVVMRADSGDVLALVGGRDYDDSPFDRATQAYRQVGSAFKPFVYAAALAEGYAPSQHLVDEPLEMELAGGEIWTPHNFGGGYQGEVTLRQAVVESNNVATVRLAMAVGLDDVAEQARQAGVRSRLPLLPSLALGTAGLTLLELTAAYTPFATLGTAVRPRFVRTVEDSTGKVLWRSDVARDGVLDEGVAYLTTDLLRDAVDRGTARSVREVGYRGAAAGKTGTTDQGHDAWFVGYTPELVGGVWIGFDRPATVVPRASGGRLAAPVWGRMMAQLDTGAEWEQPDDVVEREVDPATGLVLAEGCRPERGEATVELFLKGELPAETCPVEIEEDGEGRGFFGTIRHALGRAVGAAGRGLKTVGGFIAGLFGGGEDPEEAERQRYLGKPRLPRASEVGRVEEPDTATVEPPDEPIGVPLDSLPGWGEIPVERERPVPDAGPEREGRGPPEDAGPPGDTGPPEGRGRPDAGDGGPPRGGGRGPEDRGAAGA